MHQDGAGLNRSARWAAPPGRGRASRSAAGRGRRPRSGRPCTTQSCSPRSSHSPRSCRSTCTYMVLAGRARHVRVPDLPVTTCSAPVVPAVAIVPRREAGRTSRTGLRVEPIAVDVPRTRVARVRVARSVWLCHHNVELPLVDEEGEPVFPPFSPGCVVEAVEVEHEHLRRPPRVGWRQRQPVVAGRPPARLRGVADPEVQPLGAGDAGGNRRRPAAARRGEDRLACEEDEGQAHPGRPSTDGREVLRRRPPSTADPSAFFYSHTRIRTGVRRDSTERTQHRVKPHTPQRKRTSHRPRTHATHKHTLN